MMYKILHDLASGSLIWSLPQASITNFPYKRPLTTIPSVKLQHMASLLNQKSHKVDSNHVETSSKLTNSSNHLYPTPHYD